MTRRPQNGDSGLGALALSDSDLQNRILARLSSLEVAPSQLVKIRETFLKEMRNGLSSDADIRSTSSLLMINTFVPSFESIRLEELDGDFLSLDLGSTNFRVLHSHLNSSGVDTFQVEYYEIPAQLRRNNSVVNLFDFIAGCIESFVEQKCPQLSVEYFRNGNNSNPARRLPLGFTFSFPMVQRAINVGELKTWTKNFDLPDAIGRDARALLQESLERLGNRYCVEIVAILNDSTGTTVKGGYINRDCVAGMILGTGSNCCYVESVDNILKWQHHDEPAFANIRHVLVNTECGAFGDNGCLDFIKTDFDRILDSTSLFPGSFTFEKYFSGHFLGELCRIVLEQLTKERLLFGGNMSTGLALSGTFTTKDISIIHNESNTDKRRNLIEQLLVNKLEYSTPSSDDVRVVEHVIELITVRAAQLIAAVLSTFIIHTNRPTKSVIAIDGSLYLKHRSLQMLIGTFIETMLDENDGGKTERQFELIIAEDGSGKGAGIVAALASKLHLSETNQTN